nr:11998_t:CDS:2 [Entrophospora candida]
MLISTCKDEFTKIQNGVILDLSVKSFDQELHRSYNLMYFVPRENLNKRQVARDEYVDAEENEEEGNDDNDLALKKRSIVKPSKRKPKEQSNNSTPSETSSPSPLLIKPSDVSSAPPISSSSIEEQSTRTFNGVVNSEDNKFNKSVPVKDALYWWRNDPLVSIHHEHWHIVFAADEVDGVKKDREGESFIYMHRFMLARYDAERLAAGVGKVTPLKNYRDPIPEAFYPPSQLYEPVDENGSHVHFPSRPPGQKFHDTKFDGDGKKKSNFVTVKDLENTLLEVENWIDGNNTESHSLNLLNDSNGNADLGAEIEQTLHNVGHAMLAYIMTPNNPSAPPGVLVGARAGCRDPLFWRWHRHIDNIYVRWQTRLGLNMFSNDIPPVKIKNSDIFLGFKDELFNLDQNGDHDGWLNYAKNTIGGVNFDEPLVNVTGFTNELQTTMKKRVHIWREDINNTEIVEFLYPREFFTFFRIENLSFKPLPITFRVFIVPEVFMDSYVHWIEFDKFKRILKPYEKTIISQDSDQAIGIRKPAQKSVKQMESTMITPTYQNEIDAMAVDKQAETIFCGCGWPYNMVIPRGTKQGLRFKMMVYVSNGKDDRVPVAPTCGSQLLCGSRKWKDKYPDKHPMGYPFDRPFINNSFYQTFAHLPNVAIRDFVIRWVEDFPLLVPLHN